MGGNIEIPETDAIAIARLSRLAAGCGYDDRFNGRSDQDHDQAASQFESNMLAVHPIDITVFMLNNVEYSSPSI